MSPYECMQCLLDAGFFTASMADGGAQMRLTTPAAAFTAGAIMNLQMNAENRIALEQVEHWS